MGKYFQEQVPCGVCGKEAGWFTDCRSPGNPEGVSYPVSLSFQSRQYGGVGGRLGRIRLCSECQPYAEKFFTDCNDPSGAASIMAAAVAECIADLKRKAAVD